MIALMPIAQASLPPASTSSPGSFSDSPLASFTCDDLNTELYRCVSELSDLHQKAQDLTTRFLNYEINIEQFSREHKEIYKKITEKNRELSMLKDFLKKKDCKID